FAIHTGNAQTPHTTVNLTPTGETPETLKPPKSPTDPTDNNKKLWNELNAVHISAAARKGQHSITVRTNGIEQGRAQLQLQSPDGTEIDSNDVRYGFVYFRSGHGKKELYTGLYDPTPGKSGEYISVTPRGGPHTSDGQVASEEVRAVFVTSTSQMPFDVVPKLNVDGISAIGGGYESPLVVAGNNTRHQMALEGGVVKAWTGHAGAPEKLAISDPTALKPVVFTPNAATADVGLQFDVRAITSHLPIPVSEKLTGVRMTSKENGFSVPDIFKGKVFTATFIAHGDRIHRGDVFG
ncbi:hypothetical protein ACFWBC_39650, partial [Streptomyces sp. NPDC059985]|uniref:hypothetical protein n=1 Tax=Streptomyces sp. NPDC059985 TaxID=3347025 RepID=UPI00367A035A